MSECNGSVLSGYSLLRPVCQSAQIPVPHRGNHEFIRNFAVYEINFLG